MFSKLKFGAERVSALLPAVAAVLVALGAAITVITQVIEIGKNVRSATGELQANWASTKPTKPAAVASNVTAPSSPTSSPMQHSGHLPAGHPLGGLEEHLRQPGMPGTRGGS